MQTIRPKIELTAEAEEALKASPPSCLTCYHFAVCGIARAFIPLIANSFPPDKDGKTTSPIDPTGLALICKAYVKAGSVITA